MKVKKMFKGLVASSVLLTSLVAIDAMADKKQRNVTVIPQVQFSEQGVSCFDLAKCDEILVNELNVDTRKAAEFFNDYLKKAQLKTVDVNVVSQNSSGVKIIIDLRSELPIKEEGYELKIVDNKISIKASSASGLFYALQTIRQLLPSCVENKKIEVGALKLPNVEIKDAPRYRWRGLMLDESRHFFGKDIVKKLLDTMAFYKMNRFHWHLTDTDGWRFEVKKYPKLTTIGSRGDRTNPNGELMFYTQEDIKEIVKYAQERHIMIIPEVDMPGHATAAAKAYPEISGGGSEKYPEFTFNPGKQVTYDFLENVLRETAQLFPSPYIHYGGDEVHFANKQWLKDPAILKLMKEKNLKNLHEVEWYFNRKMSKFINGLGRKTVAWDEVIAADVPPNEAVMMWWRHDRVKSLDKSLEKGYQVVLCPRLPMYFDFVQSTTHKSGRVWGNPGIADLPLVYDFPKFVEKYPLEQRQQILGVQANIWTEQIRENERLFFMTYPRIAGAAAAGWTMQKNKDYQEFLEKLKDNFKRYDAWGINYYDVFTDSEEVKHTEKK
ncbi:beta-N-acetylhexosaminidase [Lentisphaerota bacterium WC36G]|nr:beta-N-acetylhexosaminidase [Lentisphaerae bacterium WC36]